MALTTDQELALAGFADKLIALDSDPTAPNSPDTMNGLVKVGGAVAIIDAASIAAGREGYTMAGLATGIAIAGLASQITSYQKAAAATRLAAKTQNITDEASAATQQVQLAALEADLEQTPEKVAQAAALKASIAANRAGQRARTDAAEAQAQTLEAFLPDLEARILALASGDMSAV